MRTIAWALFAAAVIAAAGPVYALEVRGGDDARWVSGGIGEDERVDMLMLLPDYNLRVLTAAEKSGAYLAGAEVVVRDAAGRVVFETELAGPFLLARLAPGKYELQTTYGGKAQTRTFTIPASGRRELFLYWAVPDVETLPKGATP
ncbi:MAG TPA: hypothetical protein VJM14_12570 [Burkholderiales bacterium]|nr:hypothetical protein [Burkholderiales bacterium]